MSAASSPPLRADARRNRDKVLSAGREVFAAHGAEGLMDAVAERAGVGVGTVYRHFATTELLAGYLVADAFARLEEQVRQAAWGAGSAWDRLVSAVRANLGELARDAGVRAAVAHSRMTASEVYATALDSHHRALEELIEAAHIEGTLRPDFSAQDLGMIICGISAAMDSHSSPGWERHLRFVLDGIRVPGEPQT